MPTLSTYQESPKFQPAAVGELSAELSSLLAVLKSDEAGKPSDLAFYLNRPFRPVKDVSLKVESHDRPQANVDEGGRITLDARVVEAAFTSSLIDSADNAEEIKAELSGLDSTDSAKDLKAALAAYRDLLEQIHKAHG